jgi:hypothetical protein
LSFRAALGITVVGVLFGSPAPAQARRIISQADSAFAAGNLKLADSLYYLVVRARPRDPEGRAALAGFLGAQGKAKVAVVLYEEARMFGGDPETIGRQLVPYYAYLGDWRALLTLPASPLTTTERRRAAWLSENPFAVTDAGGPSPTIGRPAGDTIARVAVRIGGKSAVASIVDTDVGFVVGSRIAAGNAKHFGDDSSLVALEAVAVGQARFANVPAMIGPVSSTASIGAAALGRLVLQVDYGRNRMVLVEHDAGPAEARYPLARMNGRLRVLDRGRWIALGELAQAAARAGQVLVVDFAGGEARLRR